MRVLVCGGRDFADRALADRLGFEWALAHGRGTVTYAADWAAVSPNSVFLPETAERLERLVLKP